MLVTALPSSAHLLLEIIEPRFSADLLLIFIFLHSPHTNCNGFFCLTINTMWCFILTTTIIFISWISSFLAVKKNEWKGNYCQASNILLQAELSAKLSISQIWRQNFLQPLSKWGTNLERKVAFSGNDRKLGVVWSQSQEKKLTVSISQNVNHTWSDWCCRNHDWNTLPPF